MSQAIINLTANVPTRVQQAGRFFMLVGLTGVDSIELRFDVRGQHDRNDETILTARKGFKLKLSGNKFDEVLFKATANAAVSYVISDNEIDFDFTEGASVNATIVAPDPLPVSNDRGSPGNPVNVVGVSIADAPAVSIEEPAAVAVTDALTALVAADADRRELRFHNQGPDPVALGAAGLTWARRAIVLNPGDTWVESRAANLAWSAITETAGMTADVGIQGVLA